MGKTMFIANDMVESCPEILPLVPRNVIFNVWCYDYIDPYPRNPFGNQKQCDILRRYTDLGFKVCVTTWCNFPHNVDTYVKYSLEGSSLVISYRATPTNRPTPIALTNHVYFNLDGLGDTVLEHTARFAADYYTEVTDELIPTGNRPSVTGTVYDLRKAKKIGHGIGGDFTGYDTNFILNPTEFAEFGGIRLGLGAVVENDKLALSVYTDQPGIQFYIGTFLNDVSAPFKGGVKPIRYGGFCLETQTEQNAVRRGETIYEKGELYTHTAAYKIDVK